MELSHGIRMLFEGGPGAVIGLIVGYVLAKPEECEPLLGAGFCHNSFGQDIPSFNGSSNSLEWLTPIIGCIFAGAVAGWAILWLYRNVIAKSA